MANRKKVIVGLSGGVDSAVAAWRLLQDGYQVRAVFLKCWSEDDFGGPCPWAEDQASAKAVARHLDLEIETWNFEREYRDRVFTAMLNEYRAGRTPNPDVSCNREIKFSLFFEHALEKANLVATGHYARTKDGRLYKAVDENKDQSYFLAAVTSNALQKTLFPIGDMKKSDVRAKAKEINLPNWDRPDSVGICFVGEKQMTKFLSQHLDLTSGPIVVPNGQTVGQHRGLPLYTIGQRHGFGRDIDHKKVALQVGAGRPLAVVEKRQDENILVVAPQTDEIHESKEFQVGQVQWMHAPEKFPWQGSAKLRYRQDDVDVTLSAAGEEIRVICKKPQRAVTPGQIAVFYDGDECLGCGVIETS